ncbi:hypothetical protein [Blastococcus saxobsidens]|uniref:hypothetical protein n=1 Tax=Blastococcus saxobsidens TaxID=138336 RepID=UPI000CEBC269|nr:hypothetical protein [Blastococcus saxobsidens]
MGIEVLLLADVGHGNGDIGGAQRTWTLLLWNPWFLVGGATFGMAAVAAHRSRPMASGATS